MFANRVQAGQLLGRKIKKDLGKLREEFVVLGIPRGGVVIAHQVAKTLGCSLDVIVVKKLSAPGQRELAIGAVGETTGSVYLNEKLIEQLGIDQQLIEDSKILRNKEIKEKVPDTKTSLG